MAKLIGGKKKGKKRGLGKVRPKRLSPPKKRRKGRRKALSTIGRFTVRQPRKKRYSVHMPRYVKSKLRKKVHRPMIRRPRGSFKHMSYTDKESYSNIMGEEDLKRKIIAHKNIDGQESGIELDQDNELIRVNRYP
jgi:hypothetical protein